MLNLRRGTRLILVIDPCDFGLRLRTFLGVGKRARTQQGKAILARSEEEMWAELEAYAQRQLARLGLEKTK